MDGRQGPRKSWASCLDPEDLNRERHPGVRRIVLHLNEFSVRELFPE